MNYVYFSTGKSSGEIWQKFITQDFFNKASEQKRIEYGYLDPVSGETEDRRIKLDETGAHMHTTRFCNFMKHATLDKIAYLVSDDVLPYTTVGYQATYGFVVINKTQVEAEGFVLDGNRS